MTPGKQLDTIAYPPNKPHYCVSGLLMDYPLEKLFEWCFFNWVLIRHHIFGEIWHFWEFQMKENEKVINYIQEKNFSKGKGKGNDWKSQKIMTSRKQLDTIVYPLNKPHYCVPGCNFPWKASGKFQWWKIKSKWKSIKQHIKKWIKWKRFD